MTTVIESKVTSQGVLIPRPLFADWGEVEEVEIEQHSDAIIIRPKPAPAQQLRAEIVREMQAAGLVEKLPWTEHPPVPPEERARLAKKLSRGKSLSEIVIEDRADRV